MESDKITISEKDFESQNVHKQADCEQENSFEISSEAKEQSRKFFKFGSKPKKEKRKFESFEIVKTFTPKEKTNKENNDFDKILEVSSDAKAGESVLTVSETTRKQKVKMKLRPRGKLILIMISAIIILLSTLSISNAVKIGNLKNDCNNLTNQITVEDLKIDKAIKDLGKLSSEAKSDEQAIKLELEKTTDFTEIELYSRCENVEIKSSSNWFDKLCNFISKIFGG